MTLQTPPLLPRQLAGLVASAFWIFADWVLEVRELVMQEEQYRTKHALLSCALPRDRASGRNGFKKLLLCVAYSSSGASNEIDLFKRVAWTAWATAFIVEWSGIFKVKRALVQSELSVLSVHSVGLGALLSWTEPAFIKVSLGFLRTFLLVTHN